MSYQYTDVKIPHRKTRGGKSSRSVFDADRTGRWKIVTQEELFTGSRHDAHAPLDGSGQPESDQFTAVFSYYDGSVVPSENTRECALRALSGEDNTNGAVYYYAPQYCCDPNTVSWFESMTLCYEVDGQRFFK